MGILLDTFFPFAVESCFFFCWILSLKASHPPDFSSSAADERLGARPSVAPDVDASG